MNCPKTDILFDGVVFIDFIHKIFWRWHLTYNNLYTSKYVQLELFPNWHLVQRNLKCIKHWKFCYCYLTNILLKQVNFRLKSAIKYIVLTYTYTINMINNILINSFFRSTAGSLVRRWGKSCGSFKRHLRSRTWGKKQLYYLGLLIWQFNEIARCS
jgi:hypothetical protein